MSNKILLPNLVSALAAKSGKSKKQAEAFLKAFFSQLAESIESHETVKVKGFGTFKVTRIESRKSVNVSTGEDVQIPAHFKVVFSPSKSMAEKVNQEFEWLEVVEITDNVSNDDLEKINEKPTVAKPPLSQTKTEDEPAMPEEPAVTRLPENPKKTVKHVEPELPPVPNIPEKSEEPVLPPVPNIPEKSEEPVLPPVPDKPEISEPILPPVPNETEKPVIAPVEEEPQQPEVKSADNKEPSEFQAASQVIQTTGIASEKSEEPAIVKENLEVKSEISDRGESGSQSMTAHPELGDIHPVEPFGPHDQNKRTLQEEQTTTHDSTLPEEPVPETLGEEPVIEATKVAYVTKDELDKLALKSDLRILQKNFKRLRMNLEKNEETQRKRSRKFFIWSIILSLLMVTGASFLVYYLLADKMKGEEEVVEQKVEKVEETVDDEFAPTSVDGIIEPSDSTPVKVDSGSEVNKEEDNKTAENTTQTAPTKPSDIIATDKVSNTRYLTTMAKEYYGNYNLWPYIYLENEKKLGHPDRIKPGTEVVIPNLSKYGINPSNQKDIEKAKKTGVEIYKKFNK